MATHEGVESALVSREHLRRSVPRRSVLEMLGGDAEDEEDGEDEEMEEMEHDPLELGDELVPAAHTGVHVDVNGEQQHVVDMHAAAATDSASVPASTTPRSSCTDNVDSAPVAAPAAPLKSLPSLIYVRWDGEEWWEAQPKRKKTRTTERGVEYQLVYQVNDVTTKEEAYWRDGKLVSHDNVDIMFTTSPPPNVKVDNLGHLARVHAAAQAASQAAASAQGATSPRAVDLSSVEHADAEDQSTLAFAAVRPAMARSSSSKERAKSSDGAIGAAGAAAAVAVSSSPAAVKRKDSVSSAKSKSPKAATKHAASPVERQKMALAEAAALERYKKELDNAKEAQQQQKEDANRPLRDKMIGRLRDVLESPTMAEEACLELATQIEARLYDKSGKAISEDYKDDGRKLVFNLNKARNPELRDAVLAGDVLPEQLVQMSSDELASKQLREERERYRKSALQQVVIKDPTAVGLVKGRAQGQIDEMALKDSQGSELLEGSEGANDEDAGDETVAGIVGNSAGGMATTAADAGTPPYTHHGAEYRRDDSNSPSPSDREPHAQISSPAGKSASATGAGSSLLKEDKREALVNHLASAAPDRTPVPPSAATGHEFVKMDKPLPNVTPNPSSSKVHMLKSIPLLPDAPDDSQADGAFVPTLLGGGGSDDERDDDEDDDHNRHKKEEATRKKGLHARDERGTKRPLSHEDGVDASDSLSKRTASIGNAKRSAWSGVVEVPELNNLKLSANFFHLRGPESAVEVIPSSFIVLGRIPLKDLSAFFTKMEHSSSRVMSALYVNPSGPDEQARYTELCSMLKERQRGLIFLREDGYEAYLIPPGSAAARVHEKGAERMLCILVIRRDFLDAMNASAAAVAQATAPRAPPAAVAGSGSILETVREKRARMQAANIGGEAQQQQSRTANVKPGTLAAPPPPPPARAEAPFALPSYAAPPPPPPAASVLAYEGPNMFNFPSAAAGVPQGPAHIPAQVPMPFVFDPGMYSVTADVSHPSHGPPQKPPAASASLEGYDPAALSHLYSAYAVSDQHSNAASRRRRYH
ncbi:Transcription factor BYE1 [Porphyridium purpureum]|uniref:Transcription factor BYE1 n=1 Tax=Porphyridium purpureum TaxID=35688 RepID=A0A5J4YKK2_PORPP|nr:Transcription factor BYE1 [Porphyridium purpureum]|eukprot:POR1796..scf261_15